MDDWVVIAVTAGVIVAMVVLIVKVHLNPAVALVIGAGAIALVASGDVTQTASIVTVGFGEIMAEIGLLIAWGVLIGAILSEAGAIQRLVDGLLRIFGARRVPYAFATTLAVALPSIYIDVLLVMSAPLGRRMAARLGRTGTARVATAIAVGLECGLVMIVPGVGALALAGLLGVPLGMMLLVGVVVTVPTILLTLLVMYFAFDRGFWNPERDESVTIIDTEADEDADDEYPNRPATGYTSAIATVGAPPRARTRMQQSTREPALALLFAPMIVSLLFVATGAIVQATDADLGPISIVFEPVFALLVGLLGTSLVARLTIGAERVNKAVSRGFRESGQILILTGAGGALAAAVASTGIGEILGSLFTTTTVAPLLLVWVVAAVLHMAIGSVSISAITAAGLLASVMSEIDVAPVLVALAAAAGSLFVVHVTSNTFWLLQSSLNQSTRGTFKTCTLAVSVASVIALGLTMLLSLVL
ncbi:gluconate permease [Cryobacterium suzukii]|uniref:Gluconate permease n=1 Tax=Cryobacterium suzukii TaxID=1259198 RepID=A0A4R9ACK9_9MICO|nr:SLC13 family permease [Cryobacterium suzukii]TFD57684.1 gluconate permease [Cryobacterium suzukii]